MSEPVLRLYNTLTRQKETFQPVDPAHVRMYVCGPTVYDYAHIGNARPVIVFDVLFRLLNYLARTGKFDQGRGETRVVYARNITDVDDKINARAARDFPDVPLNEAIAKVTATTEAQFKADAAALGCLEPTHEPRATEHVAAMRAIIERLIARGVAYVAENHVLFSPAEMAARFPAPAYGSLAKRPLDEMIAGARVDVAPYKRGDTDFVLWKPSKENEPGWDSPAGIPVQGRPGWHIECSAMSMAKLLEPFGGGLSCDDPARNVFDIHGGGIDLVFPHHENEIAQSCCAFGSERMANIWMHNGFLQVEGEKMSKSLGNFVTIHELLETDKFGGRSWPGEVLRLAMLKTHYRQPIDWTVKALEEAEKTLFNWLDILAENETSFGSSGGLPADFIDALSDDLNTPRALAELHKLAYTARKTDASAAQALHRAAEFLGVVTNSSFTRDQLTRVAMAVLPDHDKAKIDERVEARLEARRSKNFAESDRIRDELVAMGIQIMDAKDPVTGELSTTWEVKR